MACGACPERIALVQQERLALVSDNVPAMIAYADADCRYQYSNRQYRMFYAGADVPIEGRTLPEVLLPKVWSATKANVERALAGETVSVEDDRPLHDGSVRRVAVSLVPHREGGGQVLGLYILVLDITAQYKAETALRESEAGLRHAQRMAGLAYVVVAADGRYERWSENWPRIHGLEVDRVPRTTRQSMKLMHPMDRERFRETVIRAGGSRRGTTLATRLRRGDGTDAFILQTMEPLGAPDATGRVRWFVTLQDVTEQKRAEERIRRLNRVHGVLSGINSAIVRMRDRSELFAEACRIAVESGGFVMAWIGDIDCREAVVRPLAWAGDRTRSFLDAAPLTIWQTKPGGHGLAGRAVREKRPMISNDVRSDPRQTTRAELADRGINSLAVVPLILGGEAVGVIALYAAETAFFDEQELALIQELADDISFALDHIAKEERLRYLAYYDPLTGLANRSLLHERLTEQVAAAHKRSDQFALLIINIDRFKLVNDTLGHAAGDELLRQMALRLCAATGDDSRVARIGADEFAVVLKDVSDREQLAQRLRRGAVRVTREPFNVGGRELRGSFRSGVAIFPTDGKDADALFRNAEAALRRARSGEDFVFYENDMSEQNPAKLELENQLRLALERREFVLHYQPKLDLATRRITGTEALIRWQSPHQGLVPPARFIPILEETGLIRPVGAWALAQAIADQQRWRDLGHHVPRISVNVSAVELRSAEFVAGVEKAIARAKAPAIDLEITESVVIEDVERSVEKLKALREMGVGVSIDDFGTGYSSLGYLARLPAQALKIDRSFIITMLDNQDAMTLVSTIISLSHALRLTVIAEGVESEAQAKALYLLHCDEVQGYLFCKPVPFDEMSALLESERNGAVGPTATESFHR
jgi:diguanylate cyclase (GGDEF)-like protein/PAS domain S-box-containing protein